MRTGPLGIFMLLLSLSFTFTFWWNQLQNKLVNLLSENWPTWHFQTCWFHSSPPVTCSWEVSGLGWVWHQTSSKVLFPSLSVRLALFFCRIVLDLVELSQREWCDERLRSGDVEFPFFLVNIQWDLSSEEAVVAILETVACLVAVVACQQFLAPSSSHCPHGAIRLKQGRTRCAIKIKERERECYNNLSHHLSRKECLGLTNDPIFCKRHSSAVTRVLKLSVVAPEWCVWTNVFEFLCFCQRLLQKKQENLFDCQLSI